MADVEERLKTLEDKISGLTTNLYFGKSFSGFGDTSSDLLLKTRGSVKVQCGRKFIDLVKNGKIAVDDIEFIFEADEVGDDDGIYVIGEGDDILVILKVGDQTITLLGEIGTTYVSFMGEQDTTGEMKYTALTNIGFLYSTLTDALATTSLLNGIIYVEETQKLYIVVDGTLTEYTFEFPNPFTEQFIIAKTTDEEGALVILGEGIENALMFDTLAIYVEDNKTYIDSEGDIKIYRNGNLKLTIKGYLAIFTTDVVSDMFASDGATSTYGFRLYVQNGLSTLEVDNLVVRNGIDVASTQHYFPIWWHYYNNRITAASFFDASSSNYGEDDSEEYDGEEYSSLGLLLTLNYESTFAVGDSGYIYYLAEGEIVVDSEDSEETELNKKWTLIPFIVLSTSDASIYIQVLDDNLLSLDYEDLCDDITGMPVFKIVDSTLEKTPILRIGENIDFIEANSLDDASIQDNSDSEDSTLLNSIVSRVGNLTELGLSRHITDSDDSSDESIEGNGIYSKIFIAKEALYNSDYYLDEDDNTSRFASTEWVNTKSKGFGIVTDEESEIKAEKSNDTLILKAGDHAFLDYDINSKSITVDTYEIKAGNNVIIDLDSESKIITIHSLGGSSSDSGDGDSSISGSAGSGANPIYVIDGIPIASSSTVGSNSIPVYLKSGYITATDYNLEDISNLVKELQEKITALEERVSVLEGGDNTVYYSVTYSLNNVSVDEYIYSVAENSTLTISVTVLGMCYLLYDNIIVTMNDSVLSKDTEYTFSSNTLSIPNVSGDITITMKANPYPQYLISLDQIDFDREKMAESDIVDIKLYLYNSSSISTDDITILDNYIYVESGAQIASSSGSVMSTSKYYGLGIYIKYSNMNTGEEYDNVFYPSDGQYAVINQDGDTIEAYSTINFTNVSGNYFKLCSWGSGEYLKTIDVAIVTLSTTNTDLDL